MKLNELLEVCPQVDITLVGAKEFESKGGTKWSGTPEGCFSVYMRTVAPFSPTASNVEVKQICPDVDWGYSNPNEGKCGFVILCDDEDLKALVNCELVQAMVIDKWSSNCHLCLA